MGKIMRNGVDYGGSSSIAGNVSYNNTSSGLTSVTVQNAITELKSIVDNLDTIRFEVVDNLPAIAQAEDNVIYLIDQDSDDVYEMYVAATISSVKQYVYVGSTGLNLALYLEQVDTMPTAAVGELDRVVQYLGSTTDDYTHGYIYECVSNGATPPVYSWEVLPSFKASDTSSIQVDVLPTASADELGNIYQYVGTTDANHTNGYFYECVSDGAVSPTYSWVQKNVQDAGGDSIQVNTMPTAGSEELGNIYQYVGATTNDYTNGYFYKCVTDGSTYSWELCPATETVGKYERDANGNILGEYFNLYEDTLDTYRNSATGKYGTAMGKGTHADSEATTVVGRYNKRDDTLSNDLMSHTTPSTASYYLSTEDPSDPTYWLVDETYPGEVEDLYMSNYVDVSGFTKVTVSGRAGHGDRTNDFIEIVTYDSVQDPIEKYVIEAETSGAIVTQTIDIDSTVAYVRLIAKLSQTYTSDAFVKTNQKSHLFAVGNGTDETHRSNIMEVTGDTVNINGYLYQNGTPFVEGTQHFVGTTLEWEALTAAEKAVYTGGDVVFTDDNAGTGIVDDVVTKDSPNPVSSGGVYAALKEITRPTPYQSLNNFWFAREYYDGRQVIHYRRHFGNTSFTVNATKTVEMGVYDGLPAKFNTVLQQVFSTSNYVISALAFRDTKTGGQALVVDGFTLGTNDMPCAYVVCTGADDYLGGFTLDITIDTF